MAIALPETSANTILRVQRAYANSPKPQPQEPVRNRAVSHRAAKSSHRRSNPTVPNRSVRPSRAIRPRLHQPSLSNLLLLLRSLPARLHRHLRLQRGPAGPHVPRHRRGRRPRLRGILRAPASRDQPFHHEEQAGPTGERLVPAIYASFLFPMGLFVFGWSARREVHWIVFVIGLGLDAAGFNVSAPNLSQRQYKYPTLPNHSLQ
jgi:hypothetical protein